MRFAVLVHDWPTPHFDLILENGCGMPDQGDVTTEPGCETWRLLGNPATSDPATEPLPADPIQRHRLHYLTYEGPVSGGRGHVKRWDVGTYRVVAAGVLDFAGERLCGRYTLVGGHFRRFGTASDRCGG